MSVLRMTQTHFHGFTTPQRKALEKLLAQIFPLDVVETRTAKGNLSTKALTLALGMRLGSLGFEQRSQVNLPGTDLGLEPDFFRRGAGELGAIAGESQFALRECVAYDFLKHAQLQRMNFCSTSIQITPSRGLAAQFKNACATFEWAKSVLEHLVLPVQDLRVALVGIELQPVQSDRLDSATEATAVTK